METPHRDPRPPVSDALAAVTDLGYLLLAAFPSLVRLTVPYFQWRYRRLARQYEARAIAGTPGYGASLTAALAQCDLVARWAGDIAAGTGAATRLVRARFPQSRVIAVDLSPLMLQELRPAEPVLRVVGDGRALPLRADGLDLAVVQNAPPSFRELARVVRRGGVIIFSLSEGRRIPQGLRRWLLHRAVPQTLGPPREVAAGRGVTWWFRKAT